MFNKKKKNSQRNNSVQIEKIKARGLEKKLAFLELIQLDPTL